MDCGVKRIIKNTDINALFDFYSERYVETVGKEKYDKWVESQKKHFKNKTEIEKMQGIRKEGFIVQEVYKRSIGQDKPKPPRTVGALILKLAEYKTPEVKGFIIDKMIKDRRDIDKCIMILIRDMEALCKKEGHDSYLIFANMMNNTAQTLFNSPLFHIDCATREEERQEFVFKRNISPCYTGDPFNLLEKVIWYIKYFIGKELNDLKYRAGLKIEQFDIPIVRHCIIYPKTNFYSTETQEINTSFVIYDNAPDTIKELFLTPQFGNSEMIFLFSRRNVNNINNNAICISEEKINQVIRATWEK